MMAFFPHDSLISITCSKYCAYHGLVYDFVIVRTATPFAVPTFPESDLHLPVYTLHLNSDYRRQLKNASNKRLAPVP